MNGWFGLRGLLVLAGVPAVLEGLAGVVNTAWIARWYSLSAGASLSVTPEISYLVHVLGVYLIAFGGLQLYASADPASRRPHIVFGALVMLARGIQRLALTPELHRLFQVPAWLNVAHATYLVCLALALLWLQRTVK